jgi:hypothetical protein
MKSMSALAPTQLGQSLPTIIPNICEALSDTHAKVQECAKNALSSFGSVIKNPEIHALTATLISALVDPNNKTSSALDALLKTTFVHYIDAPSLSFLVPIIHRGIMERSADTKRKASLLLGNMATLTEEEDLLPYMDKLLPKMKDVLIDPIPETRTCAARAIGFMVQKLGEKKFPGLIDELYENLALDISHIDKYGSAQGLSEILSGIGIDRLESILEETYVRLKTPKPYVREGFIILLTYLPLTFGARFAPYIANVVPVVLEGLSDEEESAREAALKCGKVIVNNYANTAVDILLPELEIGLFNGNWRIRQNSIHLMGELLFKISGISKSTEIDDENDGNDDETGTESQRKALKDTLGLERFYTVLASIYIIRNDISGLVRQAAGVVWKSVVSNTPKTLKDILPHMMTILMSTLASENSDKRAIAARTLDDLVQKLDSSFLTEIIPTILSGLQSSEEVTRIGASVAMYEIMTSCSKAEEEEFILGCSSSIRVALLDSISEVRLYAAKAFDILHQITGPKAIDEIIPPLLKAMKDDTSGYALDGLKEIMAIRSNVVFPVLIPTLLAPPIGIFNAQALSSLITIAGGALKRRLGVILKALINELQTVDSGHIDDTLEVLLSSIDEEGVLEVISILEELMMNQSEQLNALRCLVILFSRCNSDLDDIAADLIKKLIGMFNIKYNEDCRMKAWEALDVLIKKLPKDNLGFYIPAVIAGINLAGSDDGSEISGFNLPKVSIF